MVLLNGAYIDSTRPTFCSSIPDTPIKVAGNELWKYKMANSMPVPHGWDGAKAPQNRGKISRLASYGLNSLCRACAVLFGRRTITIWLLTSACESIRITGRSELQYFLISHACLEFRGFLLWKNGGRLRRDTCVYCSRLCQT